MRRRRSEPIRSSRRRSRIVRFFAATGLTLLGLTASARAESKRPVPVRRRHGSRKPRLTRAPWTNVRERTRALPGCYLIRQIRLTSPTSEHYVRRALRIESSSGIETSSELRLDFDPSFERLTVHYVRIVRDGVVTDALKDADWRMIQPETDSGSARLQRGAPGPPLLARRARRRRRDYAYSIQGANPILGGRYVDRLYLAESSGVAHLRRRIVADERRHLFLRPHGDDTQPAESEKDGKRAYVWDRWHVPAVVYEDALPSWYMALPWVEVTEFATWNEVARSAAALFGNPSATSPEMEAQLLRWKTQLASDEERILGRHAVRTRRSALLGYRDGGAFARTVPARDGAKATLRRLQGQGPPARDAAAQTRDRGRCGPGRYGLETNARRPRAISFRIRPHHRPDLRCRRYPLDRCDRDAPARASRRSDGPAVRARARGLRTNGGPRSHQSILPRLPRTKWRRPTRFQGTTRRRCSTSSRRSVGTKRTTCANSSRPRLPGIARHYLNYYAETDPKITATTEPTFSDDPDANTIVARESYQIPISGTMASASSRRTRFESTHVARGFRFKDATRREISRVRGPAHANSPAGRAVAEARAHRSAGRRRSLPCEHDGSGQRRLASLPVRDASRFRPGGPSARPPRRHREDSRKSRYTLERANVQPHAQALAWWAIPLGVLGVFGASGIVLAVRAIPAWRRRRTYQRRTQLELGEAPTRPSPWTTTRVWNRGSGAHGARAKGRSSARTPPLPWICGWENKSCALSAPPVRSVDRSARFTSRLSPQARDRRHPRPRPQSAERNSTRNRASSDP